MTTLYETLRDAIYGVLNGVDDIGKVHKQQRWSADEGAFADAYYATIGGIKQVRAWWISRISTPAETMTGKSASRGYEFELQGFMGVDDSADTEQTFQTLVDTVMDTFDALRPNLGISATVRHQEPLSLDIQNYVMLSKLLCHHATLRLVLVVFSNQ